MIPATTHLILPILCVFAFLAGFVDAVVGGGGLIQIPALLLMLPSYPIATVFGTNKLVSITGTSAAMAQYARRVRIDWPLTSVSAAAAFAMAMVGARSVSLINPHLLRPVVLALLVGVAAYTARNANLGDVHAPRHTKRRARGLAVCMGAAIGFYDGFFGPGTGSFLIFALVGGFGFDFLTASASAKVINVATNLAALIIFSLSGHVLWALAVPMAACNVAGSVTGSRLAILRGNRFVRNLFLIVVTCLIAKLAWDMFAR